MYPTDDSFWVAYKQHNFVPTLITEINTQHTQREWALRFVKQFRNCIDIGSQYGFWTRRLQEKFDIVHCFEPSTLARQCFVKNIDMKGIKLYPYGLSYKKERLTSNGEGFINFRNFEENIGYQTFIEVKTLDSFRLTDIDFIKIDVDGFELQVLEGARETIRQSSPVICMESKPLKRRKTHNQSRRLLLKEGYRYESQIKNEHIWVKKVI